MARIDRCLNVADFQALARARMPRPVFAYLEGGAEDETTMRRNRDAFADLALLPRALNDVSRVDASVELFGQRLAWPLVTGPTGMPGLFHPDGEIGIARAAAATGALYTLSTMGTRTIEEVAGATDAPKAFQLYVFRDRGLARELIQRAKATRYVALIFTVDIQVPSNRERDKRAGMTIPPRFGVRSLADFALRPGWCLGALRHPARFANFAGVRADPGVSLLAYIGAQVDPSISWGDIEWAAGEWGGPIAIKGIMRPDDAARAADAGASAVILSNHGGRQLDGAAAPMDVLADAVDRVAGRSAIILDGGIRRGTDMLKAMALGATACMTGRVGLYGLAAGGAAGALRALTLLRQEYERDMALAGLRERGEIDRSCVMRVR